MEISRPSGKPGLLPDDSIDPYPEGESSVGVIWKKLPGGAGVSGSSELGVGVRGLSSSHVGVTGESFNETYPGVWGFAPHTAVRG